MVFRCFQPLFAVVVTVFLFCCVSEINKFFFFFYSFTGAAPYNAHYCFSVSAGCTRTNLSVVNFMLVFIVPQLLAYQRTIVEQFSAHNKNRQKVRFTRVQPEITKKL